MDSLKQIPAKAFENSMVEHIREFFPNHYRVAGKPVVGEVIKYGIMQAKKYDFTSERNVCLYITVMFMLGSNFDSDILFPWAADILEDKNMPDPTARADKLTDTALDFLRQIAGSNNSNMNRAFLTLRKELPRLSEKTDFDKFDHYMTEKLNGIFPKKYEILGENIISQLIFNGVNKASMYKISEHRGQALFIILMFFLGSAIDKEPFLPWIRAILNNKPIDDKTDRVNRLYDESIIFLEKWFEKLPQ
ncbi:MAG: hypothetical protein U9N60_00265 [Thermodesulfobacteriota bacterium]|nr:hypothetical protein [Thermodesulfobacteriota bacterium]